MLMEPFLKPKLQINCRGSLVDFTKPVVMGIINLTPDSFYAQSRINSIPDVLNRVEQILHQGGRMIDLGAYSSRPGAEHISGDEEIARLVPFLKEIRRLYPEVIISVDTFRSEVAKVAVNDYATDIINDISGGEMDPQMFEVVAQLKVPYILMHMQGTPQNMQVNPVYHDVVAEVSHNLAEKTDRLRSMGVADVIIDPGFGFGKNLDQNYQLLKNLNQLALFECPVLVGVSRKSMIYKFLDVKAEDSLNGTSVLNTLALMGGANILRVHDVNEAVECIKLVEKIKEV